MTINIEELRSRLREGAHFYHAPTTWNEAADALETLQAENAALKRELEEARNPTPAMMEAGAAVLFGHPKDKAIEFCKEEKFESCERTAELVFRAMSDARATASTK